MPTSNHPNIFTCTFCFHVSQGPPHVIGHSARLACPACHAALLNLAICWVCGELIFRGDECVSFGWCFWHRACYGCLLCGSRAICRGVPVQALFWEEDDTGVRGIGCGGREVTEAPLCAACVVEAEVEGVREERVIVQRGLRRVERVDGGLTTRRWEVKDGEKRGTKVIKSSPAWASSHRSGGDGIGGDGLRTNNKATGFVDSSETVIWVNIFDPINGPSFKPSPLKPIPLFMYRPPDPTTEPQQHSVANDVYLQAPPLLRKPASAPCTACAPASSARGTDTGTQSRCQHTASAPSSRSPTPTRGHDIRPSPAPLQEYNGDMGPLDLGHKKAFALVKEEPLKRPSSRLAPRRRRSDANSSAYRTPPEYPDQVMRTPYPLPLSTVRAVGSMPSQRSAPQSSEYLERYQPVRTTKLRRVAASLSEEGCGRGKMEQTWGNGVGAELRRFFTRR
ncbi:hypothetical protein FZEAL_5073 [Fusarium zealandicum]|uniref:LIM zinc-binding domain-containing protein n=1 Tax=Fusarium zealandicum TaxID=1053134 RepID=A0A8H4UKG4_9HYPO|nr:hypothetical protein FZEAL_5073 [Fusarium zealandicum]